MGKALFSGHSVDASEVRVPTHFTEARHCDWCGYGVHGYTQPQGKGDAGPNGALLCGRCVKKAVDRGIEKAVKWQEGRERRVKYTGKWIALPGLAYARYTASRRLGYKVSQGHLAEALGRSTAYLSSLERGLAMTSKREVRILARVLGVLVEDLTEGRRG